ncbi:efflux RND transporter periplasmic adaptor subunit [Neptunomonas antarctica]|uniref:HlyD family secretion protein n=1 Tax=Neptunomonas antarctica TaxID=619304 RepID=A0A1N7K7D5_9GAMM|nr:HlyD family efflux transporter periplasmic adaptor subunit [Neptunomonas antarctica]SIS57503.1 HlyD family secretion protein [Neptunomonas antarctica]
MRPLLREHPLIVLIAILLSGLIIWGFWPQSVRVEVVPASYAPLTITIEEEGRTRVVDRYVIAAPVNGVTCRQQLKVGDSVTQGQVLLGITPLESQVLDPRSRAEAEARLASAESALHAAQEQARAAAATAQLAITERNRLRPLADKNLISREIMDKASTAVQTTAAAKRSADFTVEVAKYDREAARTTLQYSASNQNESLNTAGDTNEERVLVRSPINGKILKIARQCEGPVATGEPLLEIGDPSALEIEVDVLSADAVRIAPGMKVTFDRWGGEQPLTGIVRIIEPIGSTKISALGVEEQRVLIISDFTSPKALWQRLGDGYRVEASFIIWHQEEVLQIPNSSLFRYQNGWALFVAENGTARRRKITIGQRNGLIAQVLEGIEAGENIINHPSDVINDGTRVRLK